MSDRISREKARERKAYAHLFEMARQIVEPFGCSVEWSPHQYEVFTVLGEGVALVVYPHRTSAGNYHLRVRDRNSKDGAKADAVMKAMDSSDLPQMPRSKAPIYASCTFSRKYGVLS